MKTQESVTSSSLILLTRISLGTCRRMRIRSGAGEERNKKFLKKRCYSLSICEDAMVNPTFLPVSTPLAPTPSGRVFPSDWGYPAHQVGHSQGLSMFSLGYGPHLLQVLPSTGPEFCPQDPSLDRLGPLRMKRIRFARISQHR